MRQAFGPPAALASLLLAGLWLGVGPAHAGPVSLDEKVDHAASEIAERFASVASQFGLGLDQIYRLSDALGDDQWKRLAQQAGVPANRVEVLYQQLEALPHKRHDQLTPYNLLMPARDRWGVSAAEGLRGWARYGALIQRVAIENDLDPLILGAYVWTESNFDSGQETRQHGLIAVGLASVQAQDHASLGGSLSSRIARLKRDPYLNLSIAAREFHGCWKSTDMFGTVMDVWYPAWRRGGRIPSLGTAYGYVQLFSNRYFMLMNIMGADSS